MNSDKAWPFEEKKMSELRFLEGNFEFGKFKLQYKANGEWVDVPVEKVSPKPLALWEIIFNHWKESQAAKTNSQPFKAEALIALEWMEERVKEAENRYTPAGRSIFCDYLTSVINAQKENCKP